MQYNYGIFNGFVQVGIFGLVLTKEIEQPFAFFSWEHVLASLISFAIEVDGGGSNNLMMKVTFITTMTISMMSTFETVLRHRGNTLLGNNWGSY